MQYVNGKGAYVDVHGPWPILVIGLIAVMIEETDRSISIDNAIKVAQLLGKL